MGSARFARNRNLRSTATDSGMRQNNGDATAGTSALEFMYRVNGSRIDLSGHKPRVSVAENATPAPRDVVAKSVSRMRSQVRSAHCKRIARRGLEIVRTKPDDIPARLN